MATGRILLLGRRVYDYFEAILVEGLIDLGFSVEGLASANYVQAVIATKDVSPPYDFILVARKSLGLLIANPDWVGHTPVIYLDGRDDPYIDVRGLCRSSRYLKRELLGLPARPRKLMQGSFGIEHRYVVNSSPALCWSDRPIDLFCAMSVFTNLSREAYVHTARQIGAEMGLTLFSEATGERAYDNRSGHPIPTPRYHSSLARSKIGISVFGAGQEAARFWEVLAAGALLLSERPTLVGVNLPRHGVEALYFENRQQLKALIAWVVQHPREAEAMALAGHRWAMSHATGKAIASRLLAGLAPGNEPTDKSPRWTLAIWAIAYNIRSWAYMVWWRWLRHRMI